MSDRMFNPELPDCYEYEKGDIVDVRVRIHPVTWEKAVVSAFTNSHGWEVLATLAPDPQYGYPRTWRFDQACQVRPVLS